MTTRKSQGPGSGRFKSGQKDETPIAHKLHAGDEVSEVTRLVMQLKKYQSAPPSEKISPVQTLSNPDDEENQLHPDGTSTITQSGSDVKEPALLTSPAADPGHTKLVAFRRSDMLKALNNSAEDNNNDSPEMHHPEAAATSTISQETNNIIVAPRETVHVAIPDISPIVPNPWDYPEARAVVPYWKQARVWALLVFIIVLCISLILLVLQLLLPDDPSSSSTSPIMGGGSENDPIAQQRRSLDIFFQEMDGLDWYDDSGWSSADACERYGAECGFDGRFVTNLELRQNNLSGNLAKIISNMTAIEYLEVLDLSSNALNGDMSVITSHLSTFKHLNQIDLRFNQLTGIVSSSLCEKAAPSSEDFSLLVDCHINCDCCHHEVLCDCPDSSGWVDANGDGCSWYGAVHSRCESLGDEYENLGNTANTICCECGAFINPIPSSPPTPPPSLPSEYSSLPSISVTGSPTYNPSANPSLVHTSRPSVPPTYHSSTMPSIYPTAPPSSSPVNIPTTSPSAVPSLSSGNKVGEVETTFSADLQNYGNMFDVKALKELFVTEFDIHTSSTSSVSVNIYTKQGSFVGSENNANSWTNILNVAVIGQGVGNRTPLPALSFSPVRIPNQNSQGFAIILGVNAMRYTTGTDQGSLYTEDAYLQIFEGIALAGPTIGPNTITASPRVWNGAIRYHFGELETTYASNYRGYGAMFDTKALSTIVVTELDIHLSVAAESVVFLDLYTKQGSLVGCEKDSGAWTEIARNTTIVSRGRYQRTPIPPNVFAPVEIAAQNVQAFAMILDINFVDYSVGTSVGSVYVWDLYLQVLEGLAITGPTIFVSSTTSPRIWNGVIRYSLGPMTNASFSSP